MNDITSLHYWVQLVNILFGYVLGVVTITIAILLHK